MAGESVFDYTALRGVTALGTEALATLEDDTVETLGAPVVELVTNGDFPTNTTGWTGSNATLSVVSGALRVTTTASATSYAYTSITTVVGQTYEINIDQVADTTASAIQVFIGTSHGAATNYDINMTAPPGSYTAIFNATATTTYISLRAGGPTAGDTVDWDNVSVKIINNLVPDGNFLSGVNNYWTLGTGWTISGGVATHAPGSAGNLTQSISITGFSQVVFQYTISGLGAGIIQPKITGDTTVALTTRSANGTYTETVTLPDNVTNFFFATDSNLDCDIDNVTIYPAVPDSSTNGDGLEIHGEITKAVVNTGSGLVAYSGFSADNYLEQPYSSNLDFGTSDFSISFWMKLPPSVINEVIFKRDSEPTAQNILLYVNISGNLFFGVDDDTTTRSVVSNTVVYDSTWRHFALNYDASSGGVYIYINSVLDNGAAGSVLLTLSNVNAFLRIGRNIGFADGFTGDIALWKIDSGYTQTQITTIYNNEKGLFKRYAPYQVKDTSYTLQTVASVKAPNMKVDKNRSVSLDGLNVESIIKHDESFFKVSTDLIRFDAIQPWREMLYSLKGDETFTFTPGAGYEPNEDVICSLETIDRVEDRQNDSVFFRYDLLLRVRE